jgi:hypothetical protein
MPLTPVIINLDIHVPNVMPVIFVETMFKLSVKQLVDCIL